MAIPCGKDDGFAIRIVTLPDLAEALFFVKASLPLTALICSEVAAVAAPAASEPPATAVTNTIAPTRRDGTSFMHNLLGKGSACPGRHVGVVLRTGWRKVRPTRSIPSVRRAARGGAGERRRVRSARARATPPARGRARPGRRGDARGAAVGTARGRTGQRLPGDRRPRAPHRRPPARR